MRSYFLSPLVQLNKLTSLDCNCNIIRHDAVLYKVSAINRMIHNAWREYPNRIFEFLGNNEPYKLCHSLKCVVAPELHVEIHNTSLTKK